MTKDKKTYTHADFEKDNEVLNRSNINKLYVAFFDHDCYGREGGYLYCSPDSSYGSIPSYLWDLYKKFERNITSICGESSDAYDDIEKNKDKICIYLKYWLYDQFIKRQVNQENFTNFFNHWDKQKAKKCPECKCEFPIKELSEIKQIKKIHDVFLFWDSYNDKDKMKNVISNMEYCKYIDECKILYYSYQMMCEKGNNSLLCKEFNNYIIPHLKIVENFDIICKKEVSARDDWPENDRAGQEEGEEDTEDDLPPHIPSSSSFRSTDDVGQDLPLKQEPNEQGVSDPLVPDSSEDGKSTGTIISTSSVGTVGFLFLLYKVNRIIINEYYRVLFQNEYYPDVFNYSYYVINV
ncbi:hypothetical protein PVIIG_05393 [Plasmodium vivax India VII]|uniref:Uncharacterized protein n=1 Tax=Plasmodium vivax India VII TaxID=1077284 RepID=A0A0J9S410_PLAVI|nr:hypothetical protein PVIIG_05393 [Plasmodium vivax India VII]